MSSFRHRRGRIMFEIFCAWLLASLAAARWATNDSITGLIAAAALTMYGLYRFLMLFARNPAFAYGDRGVQVGTLFNVQDYRWSDVRDIRESVWKRPYIPFMHFLPKERQYIELQINSRTIKLRPDMMELPPDGVKQVINGFRAKQVAALGERGAAIARLGTNGAQPSQTLASGVQAERLQRLGIASDAPEISESDARSPTAVPVKQVYEPSQPVFGRKIS